MRSVFILFVAAALINCSQPCFSQTDSSKASQAATTDSQLVHATRMLRESDSLLKADAAARQALEQQIEQLKNNNDLHKQELVRKLAAIEQADSLKRATGQLQINQLKATQAGIPVTPFGDTLFFIYNKVGPFQPSERAQNISRKLQQLEGDVLFSTDSIRVVPNEDYADVVYHDLILLTVTDDDALWLNQNKMDVAKNYASIIGTAVTKAKEANSWQHILVRLAWLLLILVIFGIIVFLINRLFKRIAVKVRREKDRYFKGVKVKDYALLNQQKQLGLIFNALRVARVVLILLVFYITLPFIFSIFPWTKGIADKLIDWTLSPIKSILNGILHYLPKLLTILVIYLITRYLVKLVNYMATEVASGNLNIRGFYADWAKPTASGIKFLLYAFMFVVIFPYLPGSDSKIFQGVSVFLGILFSLGSSTAISNVVAGFVITYMRPFKIGDVVKIGEITGRVMEKNLLVTRLLTTKNEEITVPNASILNGHTVNFTTSSKDDGLILHTSVTIGYDVPWKQVHQLLISAAMATDGILKDKQPFVLQTGLDDFYVAYEINAYTDQSHIMAQTYSLLHQNIQDQFNAAGVEIMSPHYRAARDGNATTIPADYLPEDYKAPEFRVSVDKD
ncbi:MAG TPA: mechanosensitive ion channel family protein [Chitinophaga sp.]|uniref:mechanosensitive ion channel family protein n=1 Tax=Chitinophaga sp. TaxID=1869181 RepID=UPI002C744AFC|nr:mechanosensitive ion channel family protein [Chitinophaga sp.]HVI49308.1 mechanosensitive ion channel family protein [Chitinophaga sp.]